MVCEPLALPKPAWCYKREPGVQHLIRPGTLYPYTLTVVWYPNWLGTIFRRRVKTSVYNSEIRAWLVLRDGRLHIAVDDDEDCES